MAIELDENFVEARANLGCVLAESGQHELAVAAFEGALRYHGDYPDVHYHLARTLDDIGNRDDADRHWERFLELAPNSPWADEARLRLQRTHLTETL
jgi:tetratricopeptide (TPR) repeat protein